MRVVPGTGVWTLTFALLVLAALVVPPLAWAHPFDAGYFGHLTRTSIDHERVVVEYRVEIPTLRLMREMGDRERAGATDAGAGFSAEKLDEPNR